MAYRDKKKQSAYYAEYWAKNREQLLAKQKERRTAKADEIAAQRRQKLRTDPEFRRKVYGRQKRYRQRHLTKRREIERRASKRYRASLKALDAAAVEKAKAAAAEAERAQIAAQGFSGHLNPGRI
jgi:hypothetical protein